jgi:hypothetical protein
VYAALLYAYNIPLVASELTRDGTLRALCECAQHQDVPGAPQDAASNITCYNLTDEHLNVLYEHYVSHLTLARPLWLPSDGDPNNPSDAAEGAEQHAPVRTLSGFISHPLANKKKGHTSHIGSRWLFSRNPMRMSAVPNKREKLKTLLQFSSHVLNLTSLQTTWEYAVGDPRMVGSHESIGELFAEMHSSAWWWCLVEQMIKMFITVVLTLVKPGTIVQVVAGTVLMFVILLIYVQTMPFADKTLNLIAFTMHLVLFLFFFIASFMTVYVQYGVPLSNDSQYLFDTCVFILTVGIFAVPGYIIFRRLRFAVEEGGEDEVASESESGSDSGSESDLDSDGGLDAKLVSRGAALVTMARGASTPMAVGRRVAAVKH